MDVFKALSELYEEKKRLDNAISALEARMAQQSKPDAKIRGRRGRRSMSAEEREEVSRRMSRYWATRRAMRQNTGNGQAAMNFPIGSAVSALGAGQSKEVA